MQSSSFLQTDLARIQHFDPKKQTPDHWIHQLLDTYNCIQTFLVTAKCRVGRLILFEECLRNNIVPFIIDENTKLYYYRGLREWERDRGYL